MFHERRFKLRRPRFERKAHRRAQARHLGKAELGNLARLECCKRGAADAGLRPRTTTHSPKHQNIHPHAQEAVHA